MLLLLSLQLFAINAFSATTAGTTVVIAVAAAVNATVVVTTALLLVVPQLFRLLLLMPRSLESDLVHLSNKHEGKLFLATIHHRPHHLHSLQEVRLQFPNH